MNALKFQTLVVVAVLALTSAPVRGAAPPAQHPTTAAAQPAVDDDWVGFKVQIALMFHNGTSPDTEVTVKNGIVTLRGTATSRAQKDLTEEYARAVLGVQDVNNELTVVAPAPKIGQDLNDRARDATITIRAKAALLHNPSTRLLPIEVESKRGVVTVTGFASTGAEKDLVTVLLDGVHGVKQVRNAIIIED